MTGLGFLRRFPGASTVLDRAVELALAPAHAAHTLADTFRSLQQAAATLGPAVQAGREAADSLSRVADRLDGVLDEIEEPLRDLAPGLRRAAALLRDPAVDAVPEALRLLNDQVLPALTKLADTQRQIAGVAANTDKVMSLVEDASGALSGLRGAALLGSLASRFGPPPARQLPPVLPEEPEKGPIEL